MVRPFNHSQRQRAQTAEAKLAQKQELKLRFLARKEWGHLSDDDRSFLGQFDDATLSRFGISWEEGFVSDGGKALVSFDDSDGETSNAQSYEKTKRRKTIAADSGDESISSLEVSSKAPSMSTGAAVNRPTEQSKKARAAASKGGLAQPEDSDEESVVNPPAQALALQQLQPLFFVASKGGHAQPEDSDEESVVDPPAQALALQQLQPSFFPASKGGHAQPEDSDEESVVDPPAQAMALQQPQPCEELTDEQRLLKMTRPKNVKRKLNDVIAKERRSGSDISWALSMMQSRTFPWGVQNKNCPLIPTSTEGVFASIISSGAIGTARYNSEGQSIARSQQNRERHLNGTSAFQGTYDARRIVHGNKPERLYVAAADSGVSQCEFLADASEVKNLLIRLGHIAPTDSGFVASVSYVTSSAVDYLDGKAFRKAMIKLGASEVHVLDSSNNIVQIHGGSFGRNYEDDDKFVVVHKCFFRGNKANCAAIKESDNFPGC